MHLWIATQYFPPDTGAAAVRLGRLARLLADDGHSVTVLTVMPHYSTPEAGAAYAGKLFVREQVNGVLILRGWVYAGGTGTAGRLLNQISAMCAVAALGIRPPRPDALLVESHPLFMAIAGGWLKRIKRAPLVLNVSDLWPESAVETKTLSATHPLVRLALPVAKWAYHDATQIVGMTEGVIAGIHKHGPDAQRVHLITNGVDLARFQPGPPAMSLRQRFGLPANRPVVLHVGNMSTTYDFDTILGAAARLPETAFIFVGTGSREGAIMAAVAARALSNVYFVGVLPYDAMPEAWAGGDLCVLAMGDHALAEGTRPAKLYEALATGTPLVAAIRGEGAALLEAAGGGVVVPIGDAAAMASVIAGLLADPARRAGLRAAGRAFAEKHFSATAVKDRYVAVIDQAIRE